MPVKIGDLTLPGAEPAQPGSPGEPLLESKAHLGKISHGFLVDRHKLIDDDVALLEIGLDHAETFDVVAILDVLRPSSG